MKGESQKNKKGAFLDSIQDAANPPLKGGIQAAAEDLIRQDVLHPEHHRFSQVRHETTEEIARHKKIKGPKKVALALQGGGAHGAFTWGVLDALLEDGRIEVEGVSGTSAGGMNAVTLVQGLMKGGQEGARIELARYWKLISDKAVTSPYQTTFFDKMIGNYGLSHAPGFKMMQAMQSSLSPYQFNPMGINPLRDIVESFFDFKALRAYDKSKIFLCATHVASGKLKIFNSPELSVETMLASACLPFLFHAVEVEGEYYWDGGFVGNPAIYPLIYNCKTPDIIIVQLTTMNRSRLPLTAGEIIDRHKEVTYNACLMREMRSIDFISQLIDQGLLDEKKIKRLYMHLIRDEAVFQDLDISSALNADWDFLQMLFRKGRASGKVWLDENYENIGYASTADIHRTFADGK